MVIYQVLRNIIDFSNNIDLERGAYISVTSAGGDLWVKRFGPDYLRRVDNIPVGTGYTAARELKNLVEEDIAKTLEASVEQKEEGKKDGEADVKTGENDGEAPKVPIKKKLAST